MCPLRIILIFLSATLAGFFVIRNLKSQPHDVLDSDSTTKTINSTTQNHSSTTSALSKVRLTVESGFWIFVDMASGKYLWRHLVSSPKRS